MSVAKVNVIFSAFYNEIWWCVEGKELTETEITEGKEYAHRMQGAWEEKNDKFFGGLEEITGITIYPRLIDFYILRYPPSDKHPIAFSEPPTLAMPEPSGDGTRKISTTTIVHEIIHYLLERDLRKEWKQAREVMASCIPETKSGTREHVIVNSLEYQVSVKIWGKDDYLSRLFPRLVTRQTTAPAWEIINEIPKILENNPFEVIRDYCKHHQEGHARPPKSW